jgi:hypothetical protein
MARLTVSDGATGDRREEVCWPEPTLLRPSSARAAEGETNQTMPADLAAKVKNHDRP